MSLLIALIIGAGLGAGTGIWFQRNGDYMLFDLLVGIVGAVLGLALVVLSDSEEAFSLFSLKGTVASVLGAALCLILYQIILRIPKKKGDNLGS